MQGGAREAQSLRCRGVSALPELLTAGLRFIRLPRGAAAAAVLVEAAAGGAGADSRRTGSGWTQQNIILDPFMALGAA